MSEQAKIRRQAKVEPKTRFQVLLANSSYDFLYQLAKERGTSMARVISDWLLELRRSRST